MSYYGNRYDSGKIRGGYRKAWKAGRRYEVVVLPVEGKEGRTGEIVVKTKVVGVTYEGRQDIIEDLSEGDVLELIRNRNNAHDENAIAVFYHSDQIGFLCRELAARLAPLMDEGNEFCAVVSEITGGENGIGYGVNIEIRQEEDTDETLFLHRFF